MLNPFQKIYKRCNKGTNKEKFDNLPDFPIMLDVELTNLCNFKCKMCPVGKQQMKRKQGFMSPEVFEWIIREAARYGTAIRFIRWGEPLLHPNLLQFVRMVKNAGLLCHINTNGFFFDNEFISNIIKIPLDSIKFSFHNENITNWIEELYLRRNKKSKPYIHVSITDKEADCLDEFKDLIRPICDKVTVNKTRDVFQIQEMPVAPNCPELFSKLSINWDGTVSGCCSDWDNYMLVGDLNKEGLEDIWNGNKIKAYRKAILNNTHNSLFLCRRCTL